MKTAKAILVTVIAASVSITSNLGRAQDGQPKPTAKPGVAIVVDVTGSAAMSAPGGGSRLDAYRNAGRRVVASLLDTQRPVWIARACGLTEQIYRAANGVTRRGNGRELGVAFGRALKSCDPSTSIFTGGQRGNGTNLVDAISYLDALPSNTIRVLISDCLDNDATRFLKSLAALSPATKANTFILGCDESVTARISRHVPQTSGLIDLGSGTRELVELIRR
jgi:hypothetical protein